MNKMFAQATSVAVALVAALGGTPASAADNSVTANFSVTVQLIGACVFSTSPGTLALIWDETSATGGSAITTDTTFATKCTTGIPYNISLDTGGSNASSESNGVYTTENTAANLKHTLTINVGADGSGAVVKPADLLTGGGISSGATATSYKISAALSKITPGNPVSCTDATVNTGSLYCVNNSFTRVATLSF